MHITKSIGVRPYEIHSPVSVAFFVGEERYWIENDNACFKKLMEKYLDIEKTGKIQVGAYVSSDAGRYVKREI